MNINISMKKQENGLNKYSEIIKQFSYKELVYERAILDKEKINLYIKDKELNEEFKRRLEEDKNENNRRNNDI